MNPRRLPFTSLLPPPLPQRFLAFWPGPAALAANKRHHDGLLRILAEVLSRPHNRFEFVCADLPGWVRPKRIVDERTGEASVPDAQARLGGQEFVFEVETAQTLGLAHTRRQCALFSGYAVLRGGEFVLVVPNGEQRRAQRQLERWAIRAMVW